MAPIPTNITLGTIGAYTVTITQRPATGADAIGGRTATIVRLAGTGGTFEAGAYEESETDKALAAGRALITGFAAIGAQTTFGTTGQAPVSGGSTGNAPIYARSVPLTPGTPLPPGRGVLVKGSGIVSLKLAGGGTYPAGDATGGTGTRHDNLAVVDADVTGASNASVSILY